ncbi:hypothetical protein ACQ4PT_008493 [Festuca glaucescens]
MTTTRYTVRFGSAQIDTTVTSDTAAADEWVRSVRASNADGRGRIVGLDCEWKPNYHSWTTSKVAILQLCVGNTCLVLQMFYTSRVPAAIRAFLGDPTVRCVGIGVGEDAAKLADDYGLVCAAPVDLEARCKPAPRHRRRTGQDQAGAQRLRQGGAGAHHGEAAPRHDEQLGEAPA